MTSEIIKQFLVGLGFKIDAAGLAAFSKGLSSATLQVTALATAATSASGAVVAFVQNIASGFDEMDRLATQFRTTADAVDEFIDSAGLIGLGEEGAVASLKSLDRAIVDTSIGVGRAKKIFENLGIAVVDAAGNLRPTTEVMAELQAQFATMERGKQVRIMERLGLDPQLLFLFTANMAELRADMEAIDKASGLDFGESVKQSKVFMLSWRAFRVELQKANLLFKTVMESIATRMMPRLRKNIELVTNRMIEFRRRVMDVLPSIIDAAVPFLELILKIGGAFSRIAGRIASAAATIIGWFVKLNNITDGWAGYILAAAAAWKYLNLAFLATPLGKLLLLATAVALLIDDFLTFREGGQSLIDWGSNVGTAMQGVTAALIGVLGYMALTRAAALATAAATALWSAATLIVTGVLKAARVAILLFNLAMATNPIALVILAIGALIGAGYLLIKNWETVKNWFSGFFDWLSAGFEKLSKFSSGIVGALTGTGITQETAGATAGIFGVPASAPSPQAQAVIGGAQQNIDQKTNIVVQGAGDPQATARAVAGQQNRVNADMARNMRGSAR